MFDIMADDPAVAEHFVDKVVRRLQHMADELRKIDVLLGGQETGKSAAIGGALATVQPASMELVPA
jgi:hypothetical protein